MLRRWLGPLISVLILGGVALIVTLNLNLGSLPSTGSSPQPEPKPQPAQTQVPELRKPADFREYPIGTPQLKNAMKIAAVWLPPIQMEGMAGPQASDVIHLEADVHATEANPNGFSLDEFVPYLKIHYQIVPAGGGPPLQEGELAPMVAIDGLHYGASVAMPKPGAFRLIYDIQPPSAGNLGRHSDPVTGVAPFWKPFQISYDWDYPGPPSSAGTTGKR